MNKQKRFDNRESTALASKIPVDTKDPIEQLPECYALMEHKELSFQEFAKAFKMLKRNKAIGYDGLSGNIMDVCGHSLQNV